MKTALITGATSGIGRVFQIDHVMLQLGHAPFQFEGALDHVVVFFDLLLETVESISGQLIRSEDSSNGPNQGPGSG